MELPRMAMIPKAWTDCENLYLNLAGKRKKGRFGQDETAFGQRCFSLAAFTEKLPETSFAAGAASLLS